MEFNSALLGANPKYHFLLPAWKFLQIITQIEVISRFITCCAINNILLSYLQIPPIQNRLKFLVNSHCGAVPTYCTEHIALTVTVSTGSIPRKKHQTACYNFEFQLEIFGIYQVINSIKRPKCFCVWMHLNVCLLCLPVLVILVCLDLRCLFVCVLNKLQSCNRFNAWTMMNIWLVAENTKLT